MAIGWSQRTCDDDRDLADIGLATAGVETARLAPGAAFCEESESERIGICSVRGA